MKVLVTGADGFVGTYLCRYLAREGMEFRRAVRRRAADSEGVVAVGDIDSRTDWSQALAGMEAVVHLAARVHVMHEKAADPLGEFRKVNVDGTMNLARQAAAKGVKRLVYLSTIKVNGEHTTAQPFRADDIPAPSDPYSVSKMEAEKGLLRLADESEMEVVILRPPLIYGPGAAGNFARMVSLVRKRWYLPLASIRNARSLVGIENLCSLITVCLDHPAAANRVLLASDGEDVSTPELIRLLAQGCGLTARLFPVPVRLLHFAAQVLGRTSEVDRLTGSLQIDSSPTQRLLAWQPPVRLAQGIRDSIGPGVETG